MDALTPAAGELIERALGRLCTVLRALDDVIDTIAGEAFVLTAIEGLSHEDAAAIEGVSIATLRQRLERGRADLAVLLRRDPILGAMFSKEEAS